MARWGIEHRSGKHVVSDVTLNELMIACHTCGVWDRLKAGEIGCKNFDESQEDLDFFGAGRFG